MTAQAMGWVLDHSKATGNTRMVLIAIANHCGEPRADGWGWQYVSTICKAANCSVDSYRRAAKWAVENGELEIDLNAGGTLKTKADARPNMYRFPLFIAGRDPEVVAAEAVARGTQNAPPADPAQTQDAQVPPTQDAHPAGYAGCPPIAVPSLPVLDPSTTRAVEVFEAEEVPTAPVRDDDTIFESFWSKYPRHVGKPKARAAFKTRVLKPGVDLREVRAGLDAWCAYWSTREPEFIPHPTTWLNRDGWNDPPPQAVPVNRLPPAAATLIAWASGA